MTGIPQVAPKDVSIQNVFSKPKPKNWYVFYTAPRAEKKAKTELEYQGFEVFLPIVKTMRKWKNRQRKIVEQVVFPSYIFVNTTEDCLYKICQNRKIKTYIHCGGRPSVINIKCIEGIKTMLSMSEEVAIENDFKNGESVRITCGPLSGYEGILVRQKTRTRFGMQIKEINQTMLIDISISKIEKI